MAGQRRQRPDAGKAGAGQPARRGPTGEKPREPARPTGEKPGEPARRRAMRALNPRKPPTRSRVRLAALVFAALAIVLGVLGVTLDSGYLRPAVLLALLALLWGLRALTMR
jgi:hypothetical protein